GNGTGRILIGRAGEPVNIEPEDLVGYSSSNSFGYYYSRLGDDHYVLYLGSGSNQTIYNLQPDQTYHFAVYEYNGSNGKVFLKTGATGSQLTPAGPTEPSKAFYFSNFDGDRFYYSFTQGNGAKRV